MRILGERKTAVKRLSELVGVEAHYLAVPTFAYEVGGFTVGRDGTVTVDDGADTAPLLKLAEEGMLEGFEGALGEPTESANEEPDAVNQVETSEDGADSSDSLTISLPLCGHTAMSIRNLVAMIYSRGSLLSKATGGRFSATGELIESIQGCTTIEGIREKLDNSGLEGLTIENDRLSFTGFPLTSEPENFHAFTQLASQMARLARQQKRTLAKAVDESNERYIFRIWLITLGMNGDEFKSARQILLAPLSGSSAFKDAAMEDRWKAKQAAKRMAEE